MSLIERALNKIQGEKGQARPFERRAQAAPSTKALSGDQASLPALAPEPRTAGGVHLPVTRLRASGLLPAESQERLFADQYRRVKPALIATALHPPQPPPVSGRCLVVTSALPGEGKTFTSLNLAISLALEHELNVLLVDGDVAKRGLSHHLDLAGKAGLLDILENAELSAEECIYGTDAPGLFFLPAGASRPHATELLTSSRMRNMIADILDQYPRTFLVFDSPPILPTNEARALVSSAGQIVMVVRAGFSPRQSVLDAVGAIGDERPVSLLLNEYRNEQDVNYAYGYAYGPDTQS